MRKHVRILLVLIPLLLCSWFGNCQIVTDPDSVLVSSELIRNVSKELAEFDGMKEKFSAQTMLIRGYDLDLSICESKLQISQEGKADCDSLQSEKDGIILEQDKAISTVKKQRNILGGIVTVLLIVLVIK